MSWAVLVSLGAIWGASYLFIKVGGAEIPAFTFVAGRALISATALLVVLRARRESLPRRLAGWLPLLVLGLLNGAIPYTLITLAETQITSGMAAILTAAVPLFTVLLAHYWARDERLTGAKTIGIAVGFVGVTVLLWPEIGKGLQLQLWGQLAVVAAAASYAVATLVARRYLHGVSHVVAAAGQLTSAALYMAPLSLAFDSPWALRPSLPAFLSLVVLSLVGTALAYVLYYWLIEHTGATRTAMVTYLIPVTGLFWGALLLDETITPEAVVGLALIIIGIGFVNRQAPQHA